MRLKGHELWAQVSTIYNLERENDLKLFPTADGYGSVDTLLLEEEVLRMKATQQNSNQEEGND